MFPNFYISLVSVIVQAGSGAIRPIFSLSLLQYRVLCNAYGAICILNFKWTNFFFDIPNLLIYFRYFPKINQS